MPLPDDILFARHSTAGPLDPIFLVSLDITGKVTTARPILGFSLYLDGLAALIRQSAFSPNLAGKTFVLHMEDPLQRYNADVKLYHSQVCTSTTDLRTLYELGALFWRDKDNDAADLCYKYILDRNPSSVAARWGVADICFQRKDKCDVWYLQSLVASNPEFIEARFAIATRRLDGGGDAEFVEELDDILKLSIPLGERVRLLNDQIFALDGMDRIDDAIRVIKLFNAAASDLLAIYPPDVDRYDSEIREAALLEEGKGFFEDAVATYRIDKTAESSNQLVSDLGPLEMDLGLARNLRKSGDPEGAKVLCDKWSKRWRKLASRPVHHPWEFREDGVGELQGRWEFSCGSPEKGLQLIEEAAKKDPDSYAPYRALSQYYYSIGQIEKAREAAATASRLLQQWQDRVGQP